jgi:PKD repeat protein
MANCTIVRNYTAASGGGCFFTSAGTNSPVTNVIVYGNQAAVSTNDVGVSSRMSYSCAPELTAGVSSNITGDPLFVDAGSGFGTNAVLGDYTLRTNSPCIGAGTNQAWMTVEPVTDLAGNARIRPSVGVVDMGAFEAYPAGGSLTVLFTASPNAGTAPMQVVFTGESSGDTNGLARQWIFGDGSTNGWSAGAVVTNTYAARSNSAYTVILNVTNAAGQTASFSTNVMVYPAIAYVATNGLHVPPFESWGNAATNIQAAVDAAGSGPGGFTTVLVSNGVYTVTNEITITMGITLRGFSGNRDDTVVRGGFPVTSNRCFSITDSGAVVDGFTITNGNLGTLSESGGGVNMTAGTLRNCLVIGNSSRGISAGAGSGAGIYATGGSVLDCVIRNNTSTLSDGGGIYSAGLVSNCLITGNSTPEDGGGMRISGATVDRCIIASNMSLRVAAGGGGGGIHKENTTSATVRNCLIAGNLSKSQGGGIYFVTGKLNLENCTVVGNLASTNGGGVFAAISTASYALSGTNCIVINNQATQAGATNDIAGVASFFGYSCSPDLVAMVNSNITAGPMFAVPGSGYGTNHVVGNYHLKEGSPCANAGFYYSWMASATDLEGEAYVPGDYPNMGAYERTVKAGGSLIMLR